MTSWGLAAAVAAVTFAGAMVPQQSQQPPPQAPSSAASQPSPQPPLPSPPFPVGNVEHGRYLVEDVVHCVECHSTRDAQGNIAPGMRFLGGPIPFRPPWPNDWATEAPRNKGLPGYTDQLAFRLFTEGSIGRHGTVLRPPMPRFRMSRQDAADVIAYMRSAR